MSIVVSKIICSIIISIMGLFVVKDISGSKADLKTLRMLAGMSLLILITAITYSMDYNYIYTIAIYILTVFIYKEILNISFIKSIIACSFMQFTLALLDVSLGVIVTIFVPISVMRRVWYSNIIINIVFISILTALFCNNKMKEKLPHFIEKIENKKALKIVLALILTLIVFSIIVYTLTMQIKINKVFTSHFMLFIVFFLLIIILLGERNNYERLSDEYENLFNYVHIFEDWIEKEQFTRHEYKNQLAVLRSMTKDKKVKEKIDSIIEDFINLDGEIVNQLKYLPNGGLKGLLYYKIAIANKSNINISTDIDEVAGKMLTEIKDEKLKTLTKLVGIYTDNAIEAAIETRKKLVNVEVYKMKDNVKIVISNSYDNKKDITNRYQKGITTKGKGRGNGLYFANKLISKNNWIEEKQMIKNKFYIQELIIHT